VRDDGRDKVLGRTRYVEDLPRQDRPLIAAVVGSPLAQGRVVRIEDAGALALDGVVRVLTHLDAPRLRGVFAASMSEVGELLPLQSPEVVYRGQAVALVLAEDRAAALEGARRVHVEMAATGDPRFTLETAADRLASVSRAGIAPGTAAKGDAGCVLAACDVVHDARYAAAAHHHNCMETSAVRARWDDDGGVTVNAAVQWLHIDSMIVAQAFGLDLADRLPGFVARAVTGWTPASRVRFRNHPSGGAFGRNINPVHLLLACLAAKAVGRAVEVVLTRAQTYSLLAYRGEVDLRVRLGAEADGRLRAIALAPDIGKGARGQFIEPVGEVPFMIYAHEAHALHTRVATLARNGTGWMRGPGVSSAMFGLESAMDELAFRLGLDPVDLRRRNHADVDPQSGRPWTSKGLMDCYDLGAAKIGWASRPRGGTARADGWATGFGMATAFDLGRQFPATARVTLEVDGGVTVEVAVAELGQGILTALRTIAAESVGVPREQVVLRTGTSSKPYGAGSIGSTGTYSNGSAIAVAAGKIHKRLFAIARRLPALATGALTVRGGVVRSSTGGEASLAEVVAAGGSALTAKGVTGSTFGYSRKVARGSFGAVFVEVAVDPVTLDLRVERCIGAYACGRIVEPRIARGQLKGALVWGIGQALCEESRVDPRSGRWTNDEIGEALIPTHADVRGVDAFFVEDEDSHNATFGMKGLGEIGIVGTAPAVANAFFDATGRRVRRLPMSIEHRLATPVDPAWLASRELP
jgi:xanthine dehydrogenase YagR molybdenum-binding subunit